jgi:hypothetical protein
MNKNALVLAIVGIVILLAGLALQLTGGPPPADAASVVQCQARMRDQGPDMIARCQEEAFAAAMTATDANAAAKAISNANNSEVGGHMLSMFLIGLGLALLIFGAIAGLQERRRGA